MIAEFLQRSKAARSEARTSRLEDLLASVEEQSGGNTGSLVSAISDSKQAIFECLLEHYGSPVAAKAVALKILNLALAKHHFRARSSEVLSRPFGLIADPANACNLACPGCVHSEHSKQFKIFDWDTGMLPDQRLLALLKRYGPYAIHINFCNYGEPLVNPATPKFIRSAKSFLMGTMLSTNLSLPKFDAEAYVQSGLDYMIVSVDGATQPVYEKFRKKGDLSLVFRNLRRLVDAKRVAGKKTPVIAWRMLTFEHNVHQITEAKRTAQQIGLDQFLTLSPFDVSRDDPEVHAMEVPPVNVLFTKAEDAVVDNWNPYPGALDAATIDAAFEKGWPRLTVSDNDVSAGPTCQWLYKSLTIDAGGRIFPCCAAPRPDVDLTFAKFDSADSADVYNSPKYQLARLSLADPEAYKREFAQSGLDREPHCPSCTWDWETVNTGSAQISTYLKSAGNSLFSRQSLKMLADW